MGLLPLCRPIDSPRGQLPGEVLLRASEGPRSTYFVAAPPTDKAEFVPPEPAMSESTE